MTVIRIFAAVVIVAAIVTVAVVLATWTPAVDDGDHDDGWPRVPDEQMRIIDAALPKAQAWDRWVQYREAEKQ